MRRVGAALLPVLLAVLQLLPSLAAAMPEVIELRDRAVRRVATSETHLLVDQAGTLTLSELLETRAHQFAAPTSLPQRTGPAAFEHWHRLRLRNPSAEAAHWFLDVSPPTLDRAEVYYSDHAVAGGGPDAISGDRVPLSERAFRHRKVLLPLRLGPFDERVVYVRISNRGAGAYEMVLQHSETLLIEDQGSVLLFGVFLGVASAAIFAVLVLAPLRLRRMRVSYALYCAVLASFALANNGFVAPLTGSDAHDWIDASARILAALFVATRLLFSMTVVESWRAPRLHIAMVATLVLCVALALLFAVQRGAPQHLSLVLLASLTVLSMVLSWWTAIRLAWAGSQPARYFLVGDAPFVVATFATLGHYFGWHTLEMRPLLLFQFCGLFELMVFGALMRRTTLDLARESVLAREAAVQAKQALMESVVESEAELQRRLAERTAQMEKANERLKRLVAEQQANEATLREQGDALRKLALSDPLTGLANRVLLADRLQAALERARRNKDRLAVIWIDLDNFKQLNDTHGHDVGDTLLKRIAARLKRTVRETDTVARLGGDEFVILAEGVADGDDAMDVAGKVLEAVSEPVSLGSVNWQVGGSLGLALYPADASNADMLLKRADEAMYAAKRAGRGRIERASRLTHPTSE
jgi:diguanylate cyclase (GGDEF)-like protein